MIFWKLFAWIALGWSLVFRRGKGTLVRKASKPGAAEAETPNPDIGPTWRRVSTRRFPERPPAPPAEADGEGPREAKGTQRDSIR